MYSKVTKSVCVCVAGGGRERERESLFMECILVREVHFQIDFCVLDWDERGRGCMLYFILFISFSNRTLHRVAWQAHPLIPDRDGTVQSSRPKLYCLCLLNSPWHQSHCQNEKNTLTKPQNSVVLVITPLFFTD